MKTATAIYVISLFLTIATADPISDICNNQENANLLSCELLAKCKQEPSLTKFCTEEVKDLTYLACADKDFKPTGCSELTNAKTDSTKLVKTSEISEKIFAICSSHPMKGISYD